MSLEEPQPSDLVKKINGVIVAIEKDVEPYTNGLVFEYMEDRDSFALLGAPSC